MSELEKPGRDPRSTVQVWEFDDNVNDIKDLREGMELNGIVTNVTQFGAFVDLGIHKDGLVHVSQMPKRGLPPAKQVHVHQHVRVVVSGIDMERGRIALSMRGIEQPK